jgi:dienelactone hydrolase
MASSRCVGVSVSRTSSIQPLPTGRITTRSTFSSLLLVLLGVITCCRPAMAQAAEGGYRTFNPDGPVPHPAIVFMSGCSGLAPSFAPKFYERVAEQLRSQGYVVVFADYLGRRGLKSCAGAPITSKDAARDLVSAAAWLRSQPSVDQARITAMGWSYGGGAVLVALAEYTDEQLGFSRAIVYYPDCRAVKAWKANLPVLMLLAGDDDVAPSKLCQEAAKRFAPAAVKIVVYPGAQHAFDLSELPAKTKYPFGTIGYHPQAAAAAWEEIQQFLSLAAERR